MNGLLGSALPAELCKWCIVVGIAYTLAMGVMTVLGGPAVSAPAAAPPRPAVGSVQRFNLNTVLNKHLFGRASAAQQTVQKQEPEAETKLPLELLGVFVAERPEDSAAIVAQKGRPGLLYPIGEKVPGNAELVEVHSDRIILERLGKREVLRFDDKESGIVAQGDNRNESAPARRLSDVRRQQPSNEPIDYSGDSEPDIVPSGNSVAGSNPRTPREFLEAYSEQLAQDPEGLLAELDVKPVSAGGNEGYRLGNLANSPQLSQFGLQSGDVILSVNGQPIGNVQQDRGRLGGLMAQGSARLEVQRGSRRFYVTASLK